MRRFAFIVFASLVPLVGQALSVFPQIKSTLVAGTTNREVARGIATDGTNFLIVYQGDNLFAAPDPTNQLAAQLVGPTGSLLGSRIDLAANGSVPLVEFGGSNFLTAWTEDGTNGPSIVGRLLDRSGNLAGPRFVIATNTWASEVGAMAFAADRFWIAWSQTNTTNGEGIALQQISQSAQVLGAPLAVGLTNSSEQLFPALSAGNTNVLVAWTARRSTSNAWDVMARFADAGGNVTPAVQVSEAFASQPYPLAAAYDQTNHFVVWSREAGVGRYFWDGYVLNDQGWNVDSYVTNRFPTTFGRFVNEQGVSTPEIAVSHARFGQTAPTVAFDGTNYLVGWNDRRNAGYWVWSYFGGPYGPPSSQGRIWKRPVSTNQTLYFCFLDRSGAVVDWEFIGEELFPFDPGPWTFDGGVNPLLDFDQGAKINSGPIIRMGQQRTVVLRNQRSQDQQTNDVGVTTLASPPRSVAEIKLVGIITSNAPYYTRHALPYVQVKITSTNSHFIPQWSSNAVDWITPKPDDYSSDHTGTDFIEMWDWPGSPEYFLRYTPFMCFYRAIEDKFMCKSSLRKMARLKERVAFTNDWSGGDQPSDTDLFGISIYEFSKPKCPASGTYSLGIMDKLPACTVPAHNVP